MISGEQSKHNDESNKNQILPATDQALSELHHRSIVQ
jgi:hypothetical protein